jgi:hypothetical protein
MIRVSVVLVCFSPSHYTLSALRGATNGEGHFPQAETRTHFLDIIALLHFVLAHLGAESVCFAPHTGATTKGQASQHNYLLSLHFLLC